MSTLVPLPDPSYQAALAAGIKVGDPVVILCTVPILYRTHVVQRTVDVVSMGVYNLTVINTKNQATATIPWTEFYGYFESS